MYDLLTKLPGRIQFFEQLESCIISNREDDHLIGLLLINVLNIDAVNAEISYQAGDQVLIQITQRISNASRPSDILARLGGTEFALILPSLANSNQAILAANKISEVCKKPLSINGNHIKIRVAVGVAIHPKHGDNPEALLRCSSMALSKTLKSSTHYMMYSIPETSESIPTLALESELEKAIDNGDLEVYYQPKLNLRKQIVTGAEALARWTSPTYGVVRPDVFIDIAEKSGLIAPLTRLILNIALRQCNDFQKLVGDFSVAVNLSATVLHNEEVADLVDQSMAIWSTDPRLLILEVTESAMMVDPVSCRNTLGRIHDSGVRISIDDFGTGYSSLSYLKKLPVNELKIDKSFVLNMANDEDDVSLVQTVIDLAHNFELDVVAEGIENQETLDRLITMGCDYAQGFYLARPMSADDLEQWFSESRWGVGKEVTDESKTTYDQPFIDRVSVE